MKFHVENYPQKQLKMSKSINLRRRKLLMLRSKMSNKREKITLPNNF